MSQQTLAPEQDFSDRPISLPSSSPFRRRSTVRLFLAVTVGLLALLASFLMASLVPNASTQPPSNPEPTRSEVPANSVGRAVAVAFVDVRGGVTPMYPLKSGRVVEVAITEGQLVEEGATLIKLEDTLEQQQLIEAEQDLAGARLKLDQAKNLITQHQKKIEAGQAGIKVLRQDIELAKLAHQRASRLYNSDVGSSTEEVAMAARNIEKAQAAVKAKEDELAVLQAQNPQLGVQAAEVEIKAKESQVKKARYALDLTVLRAKTRGKVLRCQVSVGETLGPNPRQPALLFCADRPLIVRAEVEQEFARYVTLGQSANIQDDATGGGSWHGKVTSISPWYAQRRSILLEPLQFNDVRTLECILEVEQDSRNPLRIGQRVRVTLEGLR